MPNSGYQIAPAEHDYYENQSPHDVPPIQSHIQDMGEQNTYYEEHDVNVRRDQSRGGYSQSMGGYRGGASLLVGDRDRYVESDRGSVRMTSGHYPPYEGGPRRYSRGYSEGGISRRQSIRLEREYAKEADSQCMMILCLFLLLVLVLAVGGFVAWYFFMDPTSTGNPFTDPNLCGTAQPSNATTVYAAPVPTSAKSGQPCCGGCCRYGCAVGCAMFWVGIVMCCIGACWGGYDVYEGFWSDGTDSGDYGSDN